MMQPEVTSTELLVRITERTRRDRYAYRWRPSFQAHYASLLYPSMTILDIGSGREPVIPVEDRPAGCTYIGLDISGTELDLAPPGSYDRQFVVDLKTLVPELEQSVDLVLSWQVLEHIEPLADALSNVKFYLRPEGHFVAMLSGRNAIFSIINRVVPETIGVWAMERLLGRQPDTVFRAYYDHCTASGLKVVMDGWASIVVYPKFRGAVYFQFFQPGKKLYLRYEDWIARKGLADLATHYVVVAR